MGLPHAEAQASVPTMSAAISTLDANTNHALHGERLRQARELFFDGCMLPDGLIDPLIARSWERCLRFGLGESDRSAGQDFLDRMALKVEQERHRQLLSLSRPILEHVYEQIRESGSMVLLADANGLILESIGDADFVDRADRISLTAGASWDECRRGTNAIGTALAEEAPTTVLGAEHYLAHNNFLTCCASPIFGPDGRLIGVLDISGDYRSYQRHTLGLARLSSLLVEKRLFESLHARDILIGFHARPDYLGSPREGLAAVAPDGTVLAVNRPGLSILGLRASEAFGRDFSLVFDSNLAALADQTRRTPNQAREICVNGRPLYVQWRGLPAPSVLPGRVLQEMPLPRRAGKTGGSSAESLTLASLDTGDPGLKRTIEKVQRIVGRDIPFLIQGESGAGKEMFAKAFHHSGPRRVGPFVALNCAAIPESLIESELFGYQGGAFTGARKEGAVGKIQQADGGTLFLDEIGDMPLNLQARLLRVLQERCITPLGGSRAIQVDISLVCATHRNLRDEVARGAFREDLYYRLNGLCVTLPPLRERSDVRELVDRLLRQEAGDDRPLRFSESALALMTRYAWPGNIRQLNNVIRVAVALLDEGQTIIGENELPDELLEVGTPKPQETASGTSPAAGQHNECSLDEIERRAAQQALEACGGNISAAARRLGVSRNTLYRKLGRH